MPTFLDDRETLRRVGQAMGCRPVVEALREAVRADNYRAVAAQRSVLGDRLADLDGPADEISEVLAAVLRALHAEGLDDPEIWVECPDHGHQRALLTPGAICTAGHLARPILYAVCVMEG
jgi:hypothetical protein